MTRKEFLSTLGLGAAFVLSSQCLNSCSKDPNSGPVDFTLDLNDPNYSTLRTNGNYVVANNVVVARTINGAYVAATVYCSHEGRPQVTYDKSGDRYYCTAHGALYDLQGKGLNATGANGLIIYKTSLNGNSLRVYS